MLVRPAFIRKDTGGGSGSSTVAASETVTGIFIAGDTVNGHKMVRTQADATVIHADHDDVNLSNDHLVGVTKSAAAVGEGVEIVSFGPLEEPSWAWDTTKLIFLGADGDLVQVPPSTGFLVQLGFPISPTSMFVRVQPPIVLA